MEFYHEKQELYVQANGIDYPKFQFNLYSSFIFSFLIQLNLLLNRKLTRKRNDDGIPHKI
ncbi:hypothetical protein BN59_02325 [Legionella massiliensis]|uniref:Uncharacterized protein n=1 Tax=Legionella massiliensis TaxID=1034943 RepID=A0A078L1X9_9GAMM|nr:hypothetical protein BN59_02325 [Legionella massiliensis]CEE13766.1 hypothetical protein BN1094_02325 [Legionella massiliensis]